MKTIYHKIAFTLLTVTLFFLIYNSWKLFDYPFLIGTGNLRFGIALFFKTMLSIIAVQVIITFTTPEIIPIDFLGLRKNFLLALKYTFLFTSPMLIGYFIFSEINSDVTFEKILLYAVEAGISEEILFRAFLFGILYQKVELNFISASVIVAIVFGLLHLYQAINLIGAISIFGITFLGSIFFAWLFVEWDYNLWIPIGMHVLMNLYWMLFKTGSVDAAGVLLSNIFRFATIGLAIWVTIKRIRKKGSIIKKKIYVEENCRRLLKC